MKPMLGMIMVLSLLAGCEREINGFKTEEREGVYYVRQESEPFTGTATWNYAKGKPRVIASFREGIFHGLARWWYWDGVAQTRVNYKNGLLDGPAQSWHENGQIEFQGTFKNGERDGAIQSWHDNGRVKKKASYQQGKQLSCEAWDETGNPVPCD